MKVESALKFFSKEHSNQTSLPPLPYWDHLDFSADQKQDTLLPEA